MRGTGVQAGVRVWRHCRRRPRAPPAARGKGSRRAAAHHRHSPGRQRGGGGPATREGDAAARLRTRGLGPRLRGGHGSSGGWSPAPRVGSPMAAAPRRTWSRRRAPERPGITARLSVLLSLVPRFLKRCFPLGVPCLRGGRGNPQPKPWAEFPGSRRPEAGEGKLSTGLEPCSALR